MLGTPEKEDLIERLRDWLVRTDEELELPEVERLEQSLAEGADAPMPPRLVGLVHVVEGFTALRHDLKQQTKSARQLREEVHAAVDRLDAATQELREAESLADQRSDEAARPLVAQLMDVEELVSGALDAADRALGDARQKWAGALEAEIDAQFERLPAWRRWLVAPWRRRVHRVLAEGAGEVREAGSPLRAVTDGFSMVRSRLRKALEAVQIERMECVGERFDPKRMCAVEVVDDPGAPPETVVAELRPGYRRCGKVIRSAEVRVARPRAASAGDQSQDRE